MSYKKPAVIKAGELAAILSRFADKLKSQPEDVFLVAHDSTPKTVQTVPSLSIVITFAPQTLTAKKVTITTGKKAAKEWNAAYGAKR